ncbi:crotonase/enoyl-CoA hydratase family protein [Frankia sp. R82]|uniref:crotonase/enoyl-CoA hydratase family protein n=1 Tax=Frankia sp. R82 TaxID=2950553 RepID=UPI0035ABD3D3
MSEVPVESEVLVDQDGVILTVTLNRPHRRNALTYTSFRLLADAWDRADQDPDIRVIIVTGAGGSFCSGMDLQALSDRQSTGRVAVSAEESRVYDALLRDRRPRQPLIAAVEGNALAGGAELLLGTDIRVAAENARFGLPEVRWGLYAEGGGAVRLPRQIPVAVAADLLLTGRTITAVEARDAGLFSHLVPAGQSLAKARELATLIAANGPLAVEAVVRTLRETLTLSEQDAYAHDHPYATAVNQSLDAQEGPAAFVAKRTPLFRRH